MDIDEETIATFTIQDVHCLTQITEVCKDLFIDISLFFYQQHIFVLRPNVNGLLIQAWLSNKDCLKDYVCYKQRETEIDASSLHGFLKDKRNSTVKCVCTTSKMILMAEDQTENITCSMNHEIPLNHLEIEIPLDRFTAINQMKMFSVQTSTGLLHKCLKKLQNYKSAAGFASETLFSFVLDVANNKLLFEIQVDGTKSTITVPIGKFLTKGDDEQWIQIMYLKNWIHLSKLHVLYDNCCIQFPPQKEHMAIVTFNGESDKPVVQFYLSST